VYIYIYISFNIWRYFVQILQLFGKKSSKIFNAQTLIQTLLCLACLSLSLSRALSLSLVSNKHDNFIKVNMIKKNNTYNQMFVSYSSHLISKCFGVSNFYNVKC